MTTNNNAMQQPSGLQIAQTDKVTNVQSISPLLPSYGGEKIPCCVVFHQERKRPLSETYMIDWPETKLIEKKDKDGNPVLNKKGKQVMEVVTAPEEVTINGKKTVVYKPVLTGKTIQKRQRFITGEMEDNRELPIYFEVSNAKELRHKIGEAFNELFKKLATGKHPLTMTADTNVTLKVNGKVISSKTVLDGGIKLSRAFEKKQLKSDLFSENICKPLFQQLQDVERGANGKELAVNDSILSAIGLTKK